MSNDKYDMSEGINTAARNMWAEEISMPAVTYEWLQKNFKTKSAAIRYLYTQNWEVKTIAEQLGLPYRHVYSVIRKFKLEAVPTHVCPVCKNRKG